MKIRKLPYALTVCKIDGAIPALEGFFSLSAAEGEMSLVCETKCAPADALAREDGWRAFGVVGPLDFSLVGILAELSRVLAEKEIPIFALSTYDTDYILVKESCFEEAIEALRSARYEIAE